MAVVVLKMTTMARETRWILWWSMTKLEMVCWKGREHKVTLNWHVLRVSFPPSSCTSNLLTTREERSRARNIHTLAVEMDIPDLPQLVRLFLYDQLLANDSHNSDDVPLSACPRFEGPIKIFNSAAATFFALSNPSGVGGMRREHIRAVPSWRKGPPRYDTVFINTGSEDSINGMEVGRVLCFFSFCHSGETFPCALIHWFKCINNEPDTDTGLWMVRPSFHKDGSRELSIIHLDTIIRALHLLPILAMVSLETMLHFTTL